MSKRNELYKCDSCGNIVEVLHGEGMTMSCCGNNMTLLTENTTDAAVEKHVPVIERIDGGYRITVGEVEHPMIDEHYIEWIQLLTNGDEYTKYLNPGDKPMAEFKVENKSITAKAYCNLHGNWVSQQ